MSNDDQHFYALVFVFTFFYSMQNEISIKIHLWACLVCYVCMVHIPPCSSLIVCTFRDVIFFSWLIDTYCCCFSRECCAILVSCLYLIVIGIGGGGSVNGGAAGAVVVVFHRRTFDMLYKFLPR